MATLKNFDAPLLPDEVADPIVWRAKPDDERTALAAQVDSSDAMLASFGITGNTRKLKSWGHHPISGAHWLLTRNGTGVHTDRAYLRYSCQIVLRNDGTRIRGKDEFTLHPPETPGAFYCLDTWSPHAGVRDERLRLVSTHVKLVIAIDRPWPLTQDDAWSLLLPYLHLNPRDYPMTARPPQWKPQS